MDAQTLDVASKFAGPIATIVAATAAASIAALFAAHQARSARLQADIANDRLALDLFQKRFDALQKFRGELSEITSRRETRNIRKEFYESVRGLKFLFGPEVQARLGDIEEHINVLSYCNQAFDDPTLTPEQRGDVLAKRDDHYATICTFEFRDMDELFAPYLAATHKFARYKRGSLLRRA